LPLGIDEGLDPGIDEGLDPGLDEGLDPGVLGGLEPGIPLGGIPLGGIPLGGMLEGLCGPELELLLHPARLRTLQSPAAHRLLRNARGAVIRLGLSLLSTMTSILAPSSAHVSAD